MLGYTQPVPYSGPICFTLYICIMAVINSLAIGKAVKSAGNLTYKTVRGRTIASQRITQNKSNTFLQVTQRGRFANVSKCIALCQGWIDTLYEKSKYGSQRNDFFRTNPNFTLGNMYSNIINGSVPFVEGFLRSFVAATEDSIPQCLYASKGTLPAVVSEDLLTTNVAVPEASTVQNVRSVSVADIEFPSGVSYDKIEFQFFGLSASGNSFIKEKVVLKDNAGTVEFDFDTYSATTAKSAFSALSRVTASSGVVSSVHLDADFKLSASLVCAVFAPVVGGKTVKLSAPFIGNPPA